MANARAEIDNLDKVSLEELPQGSPQWKLKKKILAEEEWRKENSVVGEQWIEYHHNSNNDKGGKVILKKRMKDITGDGGKTVLKRGNTHSLYLGRLKKGGREAVEAYHKKGVKIRLGAEFFKYLDKE